MHSLLMSDGLRRNAWKFPVKIAAKDRFRQITYNELNSRVNQLAHGFLSLGVRKGDEIAVLVGNRIEHLEIIFATAKIGALAIPLDIKWKALEIGSVLSALEPKFVILEEDCAQEFEKAKRLKDLHFIKSILFSSDLTYGGLLNGQSSDEPQVQVHEDDPFAVLLTSGTTGLPKGCLATHRTFVFDCINNAIEKGLGVHDTALLSSPIYFKRGSLVHLGHYLFRRDDDLARAFRRRGGLENHREGKGHIYRRRADDVRAHAARVGSAQIQHKLAPLSGHYRREGSSIGAGGTEKECYAEYLSYLCLHGFRTDGDFQAKRRGWQTQRRRAAGLVCGDAHRR